MPLPPPFGREFVGKVESVIYDRFGDFEGFTLETMNGAIHRFESREVRIAELVRGAWKDRLRVRVVTEPPHLHRPASIALLV